jgi:predicted CXXCH cytochrome family protein
MKRLKTTKWLLVGVWALGALLLAGAAWLSRPTAASQKSPPAGQQKAAPAPEKAAKTADYVGEDTCMQCHDDQARHYSKTAHARLKSDSSWKEKVVGCESCHGPGREHVEAGGDKTKIRTFEGESSKQISDTCLKCHAGREEHSNFMRGEHWRNDVGCTDCHTAHGPTAAGDNRAASNVFPTGANREKPGFAEVKMLKASEPQLCLQCHTETRHQFTQPSHHKVLEGAMKCSDCHNPHGGFEAKQGRLSAGADAACVKCHSDKQGPFAFEHAPVKTEGCASCHTPHGSANPRMLNTASVAQLCLTCHSESHGAGAVGPAGPAHNLQVQYRDCTACHVKIHGSHTSPVFMR